MPSLFRSIARTVVVAASAVFATGATAVPIVEWDLANATGQSAAVLSTAAGITASAITASPVVTQWASTAQDGFIAASGWAPGAAPDPSRYYEWSITADPGLSVTYETVTFALFRGIQGADHGAQLWNLHASTDGFAASDLFLQTFDLSASAADTQTVFAAVDISAIGAVVGTLTFRIYGYDYTSAADFSGFGNDSGWLIYGTGTNPVVEGTVTVTTPEPGTLTLVVFGFAILGLLRQGRTGRPRLT